MSMLNANQQQKLRVVINNFLSEATDLEDYSVLQSIVTELDQATEQVSYSVSQ